MISEKLQTLPGHIARKEQELQDKKKDYKLAEISLRGDKINKIINGR